VVPIYKKNEKLRVCIDFKNLNKAILMDDYPMLVSDVLVDAVSDEDITTNDTSTPIPASTSPTPHGPITRARARRLTHLVNSLLRSGSSYLDNGDTCTLVLLMNNGVDQKGRGIVHTRFRLEDRHDL
jgi:hypothetical protein